MVAGTFSKPEPSSALVPGERGALVTADAGTQNDSQGNADGGREAGDAGVAAEREEDGTTSTPPTSLRPMAKAAEASLESSSTLPEPPTPSTEERAPGSSGPAPRDRDGGGIYWEGPEVTKRDEEERAPAPPRTVPRDVEAQAADAAAKGRAGQWPDAMAAAVDVLRSNPKHVTALTVVALAACHLKQPNKAARALKRLPSDRAALIRGACVGHLYPLAHDGGAPPSAFDLAAE